MKLTIDPADMETAKDRLIASRKENEETLLEEYKQRGANWAMQEAEWIELSRLDRWNDTQAMDDEIAEALAEGNDPWVCLERTIGSNSSPFHGYEPEESAVNGFIEGALKIFEQL